MKIKSAKAGVWGNWLIKASMCDEVVCVVMFNQVNYQTYTNFFKTHIDAHQFIHRVVVDQ